MEFFAADLDWQTLLTPGIPLLETFVRGTAVYLLIFVMLRLFNKRMAGSIGVADLLLIVLISDAAQNAMASDYRSITDGLILVGTLVFWDYALDWLGYHVPAIGRIIHPPPLPLVKRGKMLPRNMRSELVTRAELMSQLREQGIDDISQVKRACMEGDGKISVTTYDGEQHCTRQDGVRG